MGAALPLSPADERALVRAYVGGTSVVELARRRGISQWAVRARLARAGVPLRGREEARRLRPGGRPPSPPRVLRPCVNCGALTRRVERCNACYLWLRRHRTERPRDRWDIEFRFWSRVDVRGPDDCWEWQGPRLRQTYGRTKHGGRTVYAHRRAWELTHGSISDGIDICHRCDNPPCCNPVHLFEGDHSANMADMKAKGRARSGSPKGEDHPQAKLTDADIRKMRGDHRSGATQTALAGRFGVSQAYVSRLLAGKRRASSVSPSRPR